jgi:hypothetical protein
VNCAADRCSSPLSGLGTWDVQLRVIRPVGISFYTFPRISYIVDVYRGEVEPTRHPIDFALSGHRLIVDGTPRSLPVHVSRPARAAAVVRGTLGTGTPAGRATLIALDSAAQSARRSTSCPRP